MNADREELSRYREALAKQLAVAAGGACPRPERIWEAASGELRPREVAELADHTLTCPDCSLAWQLAIEIGRGRAAQPPLTLWWSSPVFRHRLWGGVLAAAAAVLLVVAVPWQDIGEDPSPEVVRGHPSTSAGIVRGAESLSRQACVLRWRSPWPQAVYSIQVLDDRFELIAEASGLATPEYRLPAESLAGLEAPSVLHWQVEATAPDGTRLAEQAFVSTLE